MRMKRLLYAAIPPALAAGAMLSTAGPANAVSGTVSVCRSGSNGGYVSVGFGYSINPCMYMYTDPVSNWEEDIQPEVELYTGSTDVDVYAQVMEQPLGSNTWTPVGPVIESHDTYRPGTWYFYNPGTAIYALC